MLDACTMALKYALSMHMCAGPPVDWFVDHAGISMNVSAGPVNDTTHSPVTLLVMVAAAAPFPD